MTLCTQPGCTNPQAPENIGEAIRTLGFNTDSCQPCITKYLRAMMSNHEASEEQEVYRISDSGLAELERNVAMLRTITV